MNVDLNDVARAARVFKVLSHPDRLKLACALIDGRETTETELIAETGWAQSTMNRHLLMLRDAGLVQATRRGNSVVLALRSPLTVALMKTMCDQLHASDAEFAGEAGGVAAPAGIGSGGGSR